MFWRSQRLFFPRAHRFARTFGRIRGAKVPWELRFQLDFLFDL